MVVLFILKLKKMVPSKQFYFHFRAICPLLHISLITLVDASLVKLYESFSQKP